MLRFTAPIVYMLCIYLLSSIAGNATDPSAAHFVLSLIPSSLQNLLHIPLFAGLSLCFLWGFKSTQIKTIPKYVLIFIASVCFAAFDELHQMYVPGRFASTSDLILDIIGVTSGLLLNKYKPLIPEYQKSV
ncbi:MAG: hypothetical protein COB62_01670 [Piscirickettsiaceae bacterium]|nr:MAG: hypothetical protein COB62_01670 [Piscirickettsiaceae bacterium]